MPVMDGLEAASKIIDLDAKIPIVAMTANIMANDREIYRQSGMRDCVGKPFTSQELWHCLMKYLHPVFWQPVAEGQRVQNTAQSADNVDTDPNSEINKLLQTLFVQNNMHKFEEFTKALKAGDIVLAHRLVHTLKGNAGQIGKPALQQAATEVERQLKGGKNLTTAEQLKVLEIEMAIVLRELTPLLDKQISPTAINGGSGRIE